MASDEALRDAQEQLRALQQQITALQADNARLRADTMLEHDAREHTTQVTQSLASEQAAHLETESSRAYFQGLLETAPDGIVIVNTNGRIVLVNSQTEVLSGYRREALIGQLVEVLIPQRYRQVHVQHRNDFMADPRTRPMGIGLDLYLLRQDGRELPVEISLSPFRTPTGMLVTAAVRDITARKQAELEIKRLNDELQLHLEQLNLTNKELEAFSYSVSHDLRAPLRSIDGFSKVLLENYLDRLDERGRDYLNRVRRAAQHMNQLIEDILNLSRIGRAEMRRMPVNLSETAEAICYELQFREPERQARFSIAPGITADGDPNLLRIVLENLLGNAWKFTAKQPLAEITFGLEEQEHERVYYVRDNGAGFDMAYADKLFMPFQRLHTEAEFPGSGIGLAIVQRIITRHGGRVWAKSVEGQGSTFYFTLGQ